MLVIASHAHAQLAGVSGPITGSHGNPSDCTGCHAAGAFAATANITGPTSVLHGQTSGSSFTLTGTGGTTRGFNIAIYRVSGNVKQTTAFSSLSAGINTPTSNELQHTVAESRTSWSFRWTAPDTLGTYRVYACVNPVDNDGTLAGDGNSVCDTYDFTVNNNPPNAVNDTNAIIVSEDATAYSGNVNMLSNDVQTQGDAFSWFSHSIGSVVGDLNRVTGGTYRYRPAGQFESLDSGEFTTTSFTYTIRENSYTGSTDCNGSPCRDTATVSIRINGANDAPVAVADGSSGFGSGHVSVDEGGNATNLATVLGNDTDVDVETLTAVRTGAGVPAGCSAVSVTESLGFTLNSNGTFDYQHDGTNTLTGTQTSFSYCAYDGTAYSSPVTVYIDIAPQNDAPVITNSGGSTGFTEQTAVVVDSSISISDAETDNLDRGFVTISGAYVPGEDTLACSVTTGVSACVFAAGTLTITTVGGGITAAAMESVLEGVEFDSSSDNPALAAKTISFSVRDINTATSLADTKTVTITRANDPPTLAAIPAQVALEDTAADPFTFTHTALASDVDVDDDINDGTTGGGSGTLTYSLSGAPPGMSISNDNANPGEINWNPPITGTFGQVYGPITVLIEDGDEDVSAPNSVSFNVTVSPPDDDGDNVANYDDLCLTIADPTNADNDGDGTPGSDGGANDGGDVCDLDDDNDGMPDSYELLNSLDPFVNDAGADNDGDGVSNYNEYLAGTNPNLFNEIIDATGYFTPHELTPPNPTSIHSLATAVTISDPGPYRPGDNTVTWTPSNGTSTDLAVSDPGNLVSNPPDQPFFVRPLVSFGANQQAEEGSTVTVTVYLNGEAPSYPATIDYSISGSASGADYSMLTPAPGGGTGSITFNDSTPQTITFDLTAADGSDGGETIVFSLDPVLDLNPLVPARKLALGKRSTHRVTIIEGNVAPAVSIDFSQGGNTLATTYLADGAVTIDAIVNDINAADTHSYDWSGSDGALVPPGDVAFWTPTIPGAGNYRVEVRVTDNGTPARSTRISRVLSVVAGSAPGLGAVDTDGDGTLDNDPAEGHGDDDGDGIPNYLDAHDGMTGGSNLIPDQTVDMSNSHLLETSPGLVLTRGNTAQSSGLFGTLLTDSDVIQFGSTSGGPPLNADDDFDHATGVYDFEVHGLVPGSTVQIVIPLQTGIPKNAVYRKFVEGRGWSDFVTDSNNRVASAVGAAGACPEPGSSLYRNGLNYLDNCIQLTIRDGGPNDADGIANGVIVDPGSTGITLSDPETEEVEDGGSRMSPIMIALLALLSLLAIGRRRTEAA